MYKIALTIVALGIFTVSAAFTTANAAQDGDLDTISTGDTGINLSVSNLVKISQMVDLNFGTYGGSNNFSRDANVCVWTNQAGGLYKVQAQGDGAANAFLVTNAGADTLPYSVRWNGTTGTSGNTSLVADDVSASFSGASTTAADCGGGSTANFQVTFSQNDLLASRPGTYTGVLTFIISPGS